MQKNSDDFSMQEALSLAKTPAGQQLLAMLKQQNGDQLRQAMNQAAAGNYASVQNTLASLLSNPEAQALLRQLQEGSNG